MNYLKSISFIVIFFTVNIIVGQEQPPIEVFLPKVYGGENKNWSISQSKENYIYVGNNNGLLEFNGADWKLYASTNENIIRSVNVIEDLIYTGSYREFGYWRKNEFGILIYTSLSKKLDVNFLEDEEIWNIISLDDYILFQSLKRIYIFNKNDESCTTINSDTTIYKMLKIDNEIYFQKDKEGIFKIEQGSSKLISDNPVLKDGKLVNMYRHNNDLLVQMENNGLYVLSNNNLRKWEAPINNEISNFSVYRSIKLRDGGFILGTRSNGVLHLTHKENLDYELNKIHGLSNKTVLAIYEDAENNIWVGLQNGINCVNINAPFSIYNDEDGKIGEVHASIIFNNNLYLGTNQGLFYKAINSADEFKIIQGTQGQVWSLVEIDNTLFCGHDYGTFVIKQHLAEKIKDTRGTWNIVSVQGKKDIILEGNYKGLDILEKKNNKWVFKNKIEGFNISSRFFEMYGENGLLVSHDQRGVFNITLNKDLTNAIQVEKDSIIGDGLKSSLIKYNNNILYTYKEGVFKYDLEKNIFIKDTLLSTLIDRDNYISGKLIFNREANVLWGFSKKNMNYMSANSLSSTQKARQVSFSKVLPKGTTGYENIFHLVAEKYLMGTSTGYFVLDLNKVRPKTYDISINSIAKSGLKDSLHYVDKTIKGDFRNSENNLEITFSVAEFDKYIDTEYQYQLEGMYNEWSDWTSKPSVKLTNLSYGDYVFNVRAKTGNVISNNIESYVFNIERPWYLSNLFIIIYIIAISLFSLIMHNIYKRYYKKQRERILSKTTRELGLKELENKQQLMRFNNDKLRQDIDNKNRELGISTMSLIKKNEFLNTLKKELKNADSSNNLKHIIKIIDKNLNNTDDWQVFEEAFNNADKDFLKKVKQEHQSLTSNDLRLCAYLRLNLSSKEIAPLLNISFRSVEVKRYRLRKKMGLQRESSLSDYILEI